MADATETNLGPTKPEHVEKLVKYLRTVIIKRLVEASAREGGVVIHAGTRFKEINNLAERVKEVSEEMESYFAALRRTAEAEHE